MSLGIRKVTPAIGAEISGVDLTRLGNAEVSALHEALMAHQVLFFRDQTLSVEQHKAFGRLFGELAIHPNTPGPEGHPEIGSDKLWDAGRDKRLALTERGHDFAIVTQFAFDAEPVLAWIARQRADHLLQAAPGVVNRARGQPWPQGRAPAHHQGTRASRLACPCCM